MSDKNVSFLQEKELRREPMLDGTCITFGSPELCRLQREVTLHRWVLVVLCVTNFIRVIWGPLP